MHALAVRPPARRWTAAPTAQAAGSDIPRSFESCVQQACHSVRISLFGAKKPKGRRVKGLKRLSVEIPALETSVERTMFLTRQLLDALQGDGRTGASVVYCSSEFVDAAQEELPRNLAVHAANAANADLNSRLLIFNPTAEHEVCLFELLDDVWRGEAVVLYNPEFSDGFKTQNAAFVDAFNTVYCFMPLAIKVFIQDRQGALFLWQKEKDSDAKWRVFMEENKQFKQIGQQARRPTQEELETTLYNATAAESPITKGLEFISSFGKKK